MVVKPLTLQHDIAYFSLILQGILLPISQLKCALPTNLLYCLSKHLETSHTRCVIQHTKSQQAVELANLYKGKTCIYDPLSLALLSMGLLLLVYHSTLFSYLQQLENYHDPIHEITRNFDFVAQECLKCLCCRQTMPNAHYCNSFVGDKTCRSLSLPLSNSVSFNR